MPEPEPAVTPRAGAADEAHIAGARSGRSRSDPRPVTVRLQCSEAWAVDTTTQSSECDHNKTGYLLSGYLMYMGYL